MRYSELISFNPIEDIIQLTTADDANKAREYVKSYVMSDAMAESMKEPVINQLVLEENENNRHGVLVVGNYGTGKSHLMSVISAVATDADNLQYLQNKKFAEAMKPVAGKFEVLRIEIGGVTMSLREILFSFIQDDFDTRGVNFKTPDFATVRDNKKLIKDMMAAFQEKYPDKGYLIVVDEFLSYLTSRNEREIVLDLEFFRALGEMCSKSNLRVIFGVQEKIFENPKFSFVSDTLMHVKDRFTQIIITKEATSFVVSERILKKTPEQKARIRAHLEKFCNLYGGMSSKLDDFVNLFPIHPSYIDVFNKVYLIENRHILKNISLTIRDIFNQQVPENAPGIISFDSYWPAIKNNGLLKSDATVSRVVNASLQLEEIINRAFTKPAYKPMAIQIIYALSVHRLTTNGLDVHFGLTAENLKDDLCLHLMMPEQDADFLLGAVNATLREIMKTVSGQFIIHNEANNQYYIDVDKVVDYDEKIKQKATILSDVELNRFFYQVIYACLEWDQKQYVSGFNIYEHDLNWASHNIFREGYFFMGLPGERSTAQPERDFYIHIMPHYGKNKPSRNDVDDEVYFYFKGSNDIEENIRLYAAAQLLAEISEGKDKEAYLGKAMMLRKKIFKFLNESKNTCFDVVYKKERRQMIEVLQGKANRDATFGETIDLAASMCLDGYFNSIYPDFPIMKTRITRKNMADSARVAFDHFAGRKTQQSTMMLQSFGILEGDKIRPEGSKFASYYIDMVKKLPGQGVLNYSDLFEPDGLYQMRDKRFRIWNTFTPIIFLALVYAGYAVLTLKDGSTLSAANLDKVPKMGVLDLYEFKYLSKPAQMSMAELKKLFDIMDLNPALLDNPNTREKAVADLLAKAKSFCNDAVILEHKLGASFSLWGEPLVNDLTMQRMTMACQAVKNEFSNYSAKFNTPAKLNNFNLSMEDLGQLKKHITLLQRIPEYITFQTECISVINYIAAIEYVDLGTEMKARMENAKASFRDIRDGLLESGSGDAAAQQVKAELEQIKDKYIELYFANHKKKRLGIDDAKRKGQLQESTVLSSLRKLKGIDILSGAKLTMIEQDMANLRVCYELTPAELKQNPVCPHCHYSMEDHAKNIYGQLDNLEERIDKLAKEWAKTLLDTISDPLVLGQKQFLNAKQAEVIDQFVKSEKLPVRIDDFFVNSILALLKDYEPVVIHIDDLLHKLEQLPPMDESTFKKKLNNIISEYTYGKDPNTLRIVIKRQESEN